MDVTKPVLCVSSLRDLSLSEVILWLTDYRRQVEEWSARCPPGHDQVAELMEEFAGDLLMAAATAEQLHEAVLDVAVGPVTKNWQGR